jgi:sugar-specific transcriptional regulator TrmB
LALESHDEATQILTQLGLTLGQARVYLALVRSEMSTIKTISGVTKIARQDIYRIVSTLEKIGLIEKAITAPIRVKAVPMRDGLSFLLGSRACEFRELSAKTKQLIKNWKMENKVQKNDFEGPKFILVPEKKTVEKRRKNEIEAAQESIDVIIPPKSAPRIVFSYADVINKALKRGVKIRLIIEESEDENSFPDALRDFKKYPSLELRYAFGSPPVILAIYDRKRMLVTVSQVEDVTQSLALWSNNPSLLAVIQHYFEVLWNTSNGETPEDTRVASKEKQHGSG